MKATKVILFTALAVVLALNFAMMVKADYSYNLTSDCGPNVPINTSVTITATTNDEHAYKVLFVWTSPSYEFSTDPVPISSGSASTTRTVDEEGEWTVTAVFLDKFNLKCFEITVPVAFRCIKLFVHAVPEIPLIGTAGISLAMMAGLTYKLRKKQEVTS